METLKGRALNLAAVAAAASVITGCAWLPRIDTPTAAPQRVAANPPGFGNSDPQTDQVRMLRAERDVLQHTVTQLQQEMEEVRQLLRLRTAPLPGESAAAGPGPAAPAPSVLPGAQSPAGQAAQPRMMMAAARADALPRELVQLGAPGERIAASTAIAESKPAPDASIVGMFRMPEALVLRFDPTLKTVPR